MFLLGDFIPVFLGRAGPAGSLDSGIYHKALCQGLQRVLEPYQQDLIQIERELLADPHLGVIHVQTRFEKVQMPPNFVPI